MWEKNIDIGDYILPSHEKISWKFVALKVLKSETGKDSLKSKVLAPAFSSSSEEEVNLNSSFSSPINDHRRENLHFTAQVAQIKKQRNAMVPNAVVERVASRRKNYLEMNNKHSKKFSVNLQQRPTFRKRSYDEKRLREQSMFTDVSRSEITEDIKTLPSAAKRVIILKRRKRRVAKSCHCSKCGLKTSFELKIQILHSGVIKQQLKSAQTDLLKKVITRMIYKYKRRKNIQKRSTTKMKKAMKGNLARSSSKKYDKINAKEQMLFSPPLPHSSLNISKHLKSVDSGYGTLKQFSSQEDLKAPELRLSTSKKASYISSYGYDSTETSPERLEKKFSSETQIIQNNLVKTEGITITSPEKKSEDFTLNGYFLAPNLNRNSRIQKNQLEVYRRVFGLKKRDDYNKIEPALNKRKRESSRSPIDYSFPRINLFRQDSSDRGPGELQSPKYSNEYYFPEDSRGKTKDLDKFNKKSPRNKPASPYSVKSTNLSKVIQDLNASASQSKMPRIFDFKKNSSQVSLLSRSIEGRSEERDYSSGKVSCSNKETAKKLASSSQSTRFYSNNTEREVGKSSINSPRLQNNPNIKESSQNFYKPRLPCAIISNK